MKQAQEPAWPFNPNFPEAFAFPAFASVAWWAFARWPRYKGKAAEVADSDKCKLAGKPDWQYGWNAILADNFAGATAFPDSFSDRNYAMKHPGGWVETLLDAQRFWCLEINGWALRMVEQEFRETDHDALELWHYAGTPDGAKQCEHFCRRFHAYQQARYRWHEHFLEKHCARALGKGKKAPTTGTEARACISGWLSRQKRCKKHPLVTQYTRRKARPEYKRERFFFDKERFAPSSRRYSAMPDEIGWLILTWPIWNWHAWRWTDIGAAVITKFRFVDAKGNPLDLLKTSWRRLRKALRENLDGSGSMPAEKAHSLIYKFLLSPTPKEKESHQNWELRVRNRRGEKAIEKLARLAIGRTLANRLKPRPRGKGTDEKPLLWEFARQLSA